MPIGSGRVTPTGRPGYTAGPKTRPIVPTQNLEPTLRTALNNVDNGRQFVDNTTDLYNQELKAKQQFAHISVPDDASGKRTRRGSFDSANSVLFSGTVVVAPTPGGPGSSGGA